MRTCLASTVEYSGRSVATPTYKVYYPLDTSMLLRGGVVPKAWQNVGKLPMRAEVAAAATAAAVAAGATPTAIATASTTTAVAFAAGTASGTAGAQGQVEWCLKLS